MAERGQSRAFAWADYLALARELASRSDEASLRSAVSRSYYALFHGAQTALKACDPEYASHRVRDGHKQVWDRLAGVSRRQAKSAAMRGRTLLVSRHEADYRASGGRDWAREARDAVARAEAALRALSDLTAKRG